MLLCPTYSKSADDCFIAAGIYAAFVVGTSLCIVRNNKRRRDERMELDWASGKEAAGIAGVRSVGYGRYIVPMNNCPT